MESEEEENISSTRNWVGEPQGAFGLVKGWVTKCASLYDRAHCFVGEVTEEVESCPYLDWGSVFMWAGR